MNIIKRLIENRANKLLDELEEVSDRISNRIVNAHGSISPVELARASELPKEDLREIVNIQNKLTLLEMTYDALFGDKK